MLNLTPSDLKVLNTLKLNPDSDPINLIKAISDVYYSECRFREGFKLFKDNPHYAPPLEYMAYMIFFNEYNINSNDQYKYLMFDIIKYRSQKIKIPSNEIIKYFTIDKNKVDNISKVDNQVDERYFNYQTLINNTFSKDELLHFTYSMFLKGPYNYEALVDHLKEYERLDVIQIILSKYHFPDLQILCEHIRESRSKDKLDIIRSVLTDKQINKKFVCEISDYETENL